MLRNFDTDLDTAGVTRMVVVQDHVAVRPSTKTHLLSCDEEWTWRELRDYVTGALAERFGPPAPDSQRTVKEAGIFKSFLSRWGAQAPRIARYIIEVCDGHWQGRPITVTSFCKNADPYFAAPIAERLTIAQ